MLNGGGAARTLGYYEPGDGGGALYEIIDDSDARYNASIDDGGSVYDLDNGNKALLIIDKDEINIKQFGCYGDGTHDDTAEIKNAIAKAISLHKKIIIPEGTFNISETITINNPILITGVNSKFSIINIIDDIIGFKITRSYVNLQNMQFKTPNNYTQSAIELTNVDGHTWAHYIENCTFAGVGKTGIGISINPRNNYGNMTINIYKITFTGLNTGIYFNIVTGWSNGGIIKDCWEYDCTYGINFSEESKSIGSWRIENFKGQYGAGSIALINNLKASQATIDDVILWDGGKTLDINKKSIYVIVKNCINLGRTKFTDYGYRTKVIDIDQRYNTKYFEIEEKFWGAQLDTNHWYITQSSQNSTIVTGLSKSGTGLHKPSVKLTTDSTTNDSILINFNGKEILPEYAGWYMNFSFFFSDITNIDFRLGSSTHTTNYGNWFTIDAEGHLVFVAQSGTIKDSLIVDENFTANKWYNIQLYFSSDNSFLDVWNNAEYVGRITPTRWDQEPYFYIKTLDDNSKSVSIADLIIKGFIY